MLEFRRKASEVALSLPVALLFFLAAALITYFKIEVIGVLIFVGLLTVLLLLCDDIMVTTLPFLLLCMFVLKCYDSFDTFIVFAGYALIPITALVLHVVLTENKFSIGKSFWGIVAVAVSVTLGGLFSISSAEYFSGTSLFYVTGLGIGMLGAYLLMKREFIPSQRYSITERLFALFYIAGCFGVFMLAQHYIAEFATIREEGLEIQWSNNLSTMMMFFMPAPFYYAITKNRLHFFVGVLFYLAIVASGSRGALLMGGVEFVLCLLYVATRDKYLRILSILTILAGLYAVFTHVDTLIQFFEVKEGEGIISDDESRARLLRFSIKDFLDNPVFGQGIGYTGNSDTYNPKKGAANWYHMMIPQIIGSLGSVGILAYGYQFYTRARLIFKKPTVQMMTLGLSYAGILLMSQVNPGEFCPIPYELLTVLLFIFLELPREELDGRKKGAFIPLFKKNITSTEDALT